jgi:hypothetical protein
MIVAPGGGGGGEGGGGGLGGGLGGAGGGLGALGGGLGLLISSVIDVAEIESTIWVAVGPRMHTCLSEYEYATQTCSACN